MKTYAKIMQGTINFPSHFSKEAVSIIKKLLQHKPTKRLGVVNGGASEIKRHPWFRRSFAIDCGEILHHYQAEGKAQRSW